MLSVSKLGRSGGGVGKGAPRRACSQAIYNLACAQSPPLKQGGMTVHGLFALYLKSASIGPVLFKTCYR